MEDMTTVRRWTALLALSLGGFGIGLTEFVAMGLLPDISRDLLPQLYAQSSAKAVAHGGWMITAYALGVVVGAPTIAALTARLPRKTLVLGLLGLFTLGTVASALAPGFPLVLAARFLAALPHGAYFGAAGLLAAAILGPGSQGKGFAVVLGGLTAANVFGVPLITRLGQAAGWRVAYLAIAAMFALTLVFVLLSVPHQSADPTGSPRAELRAFRSPQVWLVATTAAVGFGGFFAIDSYIAPVTTQVAGLSESAVPWVLVAIGLGMTAGNALGGWASDRNLRRSLLSGFVVFIASMAAFAVLAHNPYTLFLGAFFLGAAGLFLGPAMQSRLIGVAPGAQLMGAAVSQSAMNIANSLGAALGGLVIAAGWGYTAPSWVGVALGATGLALAAASFALDARRRNTTPTPDPAQLQPTP
ncbi:MFS transporter [Dactylosporangium matsuzakiense]|uniref:MFS transporter n=1 Tax=Dactylosporangium matsuzakiense TaxID=53360 RepID=A0A9W6KNT1_9ACTN|nr:MFS transporter [Dactylosporangium matsuzakiense]UWZ41851.1 MFS transporter [Dactylosporangium matsuzakiense]GLL04492.1 MFS transporter [Dactylosporangium matsuzakiense]